MTSLTLVSNLTKSLPAVGGKDRPRIGKRVFWNMFQAEASRQGLEFKITAENEKIIYTILRYFLLLEDFNAYGILKNRASLQKGLLVYGDYGVGKSTLFNIIHEVGKTIILKTNISQLWFPKITTVNMLTRYYDSQKDPTSDFKLENYYRGKLYLDDLGKEDKAYNREELIGKLLFERHRRRLKTFVTTNEKPSAIAERYGNHIGDRLPEMFNIIKWEGRSWRE
ncbi:hypothetical protein [Christiangramia sediminis]|uniref:Uncharacterized protein n=1 Tax=Christiangramia sediminis TaxID=2881336 RepID=A0A9X1RYT1_9FLAO|nr:hypothetical protein [Christiangramia sediminis]MCB7481595.1 hypothetical protein [Christiangramia sediminis]